MIHCYEDALSVTTAEDGAPVVKFLKFEQNNGQRAELEVAPNWCNVSPFSISVEVPVVTPVDFDWSGGLYGHVIKYSHSNSFRYCHPLFYSGGAQRIMRAYPEERANTFIDVCSTNAWDFQWWSWYDRVQEAVINALHSAMSRSVLPTPEFFRSIMQRHIDAIVNGAKMQSGLPLTDDFGHEDNPVKILRQMYEVEVGYPEIPSTLLREEVKLKLLQCLDQMNDDIQFDILYTGKNHVGKYVGRVRPDAPKSNLTNRPIFDLVGQINPLATLADPKRVNRETRGIIDCLPFENPIPPVMRLQGVPEPPQGVLDRLTMVNVLIANIEDLNVHVADPATAEEFGYPVIDKKTGEEKMSVQVGDRTCLDGIIILPSGMDKLGARQVKSDLITAEQFNEQLPELRHLPGFNYEIVNTRCEVMDDGTEVFEHNYRYWFDSFVGMGNDKLKFANGGIKGVGRPGLPQLFVKIDNEPIEVDVIIAEDAVLGKGAKDVIWAALLNLLQTRTINPKATEAQLVDYIEGKLGEYGLPTNGRFQVYKKKRVPIKDGEVADTVDDSRYVEIMEMFEMPITWRETDILEPHGNGIFGPLAVMRGNETEGRQTRSLASIAVNMQLRCVVGREFPYCEKDRKLIEKIANFSYRYSDQAPQQQA